MKGPQELLSWEREREIKVAAWCAALGQPVALTGATGFLGSHLLETLLAHGVSVRVLVRNPAKMAEGVRSRVHLVVGDLMDEPALEELVQGCGTVIHVAGLVRANSPRAFQRANVAGTEKLVRKAERAGCPRLVYVSSLAAAGPSPSPRGKAPEDSPQPISAYGRSKLAGEAAVRLYRGAWVIVRPPAIYGPRDRDVFTFFRLASFGWLPFPAGERFLTVAFVEDVVLALLAASAGTQTSCIFQVGEPEPYEIRQLLTTLASSGGVRARVIPLPGALFRLAGLVGNLLHGLGFQGVAMTADKARELLARHWVAQTEGSLKALDLPKPVSFAEGARRTWAWYRQVGWLPHGTM